MHGPLVIAERRSLPRHSAKERATAVVDGAVMRGCVLLDFSQRGARLGLGAPNPLPLRFELRFPSGHCVNAMLVWQRNLVAGVSFDMPLTLLQRLSLWNWHRRSKAEAPETGYWDGGPDAPQVRQAPHSPL
jgi:hypothetical protein